MIKIILGNAWFKIQHINVWYDRENIKTLFILKIYLYVINQTLRTSRMWHKINFLVELNRIEFRLFLLQDRGSFCSEMDEVLDCGLEESSNSNPPVTFTIGLILLGKVWTSLSPNYGLNIITFVIRQGMLWYQITFEGLNAINKEIKLNNFSLTGYYTGIKKPSGPFCFPIPGGWIVGYIPILRVLALFDMQTTSFWIWTQITVSISIDIADISRDQTTSAFCFLILSMVSLKTQSSLLLVAI